MGGNCLLKLNIDSRPIANKYREGKVKRTLKRELKVPEIAEMEANGTSSIISEIASKSFLIFFSFAVKRFERRVIRNASAGDSH